MIAGFIAKWIVKSAVEDAARELGIDMSSETASVLAELALSAM